MKKTLLFLLALIINAGIAFGQDVFPLGLPDIGGDGAGNGGTQPGWNLTAMGVMDQVAAAKYLVLETEGIGDNADGFGGLHLIYQGNDGASIDTGWKDAGVNGDFVKFARADGQVVSIAIDIKAALGANYDDFFKCTWARFIIAYYPSGMTAIDGLGLTNVYLANDFAKPDDAADLVGSSGTDDFGFVFNGSVNDLLGGGGTTIAPSSSVPGVYIAAMGSSDGYTGATINMGSDNTVWPWSNGDNGDANVAFTPEKDATYHMEFNVTSVNDGNAASGFRVRWLKDDAYDNHTAADATAVNDNVYKVDETAVLIPALFSGTIAAGDTNTYNVDFTMDGSQPADGLVGNLGIRGHYGATGFVINTIKIWGPDGTMLVNYDKDAPGTSIATVKLNASSNAYGVKGGIIVNAVNEKVSVFSIDGRLVKQAVVTGNNSTLPLLQGIYIVKVGAANPVKVLVK